MSSHESARRNVVLERILCAAIWFDELKKHVHQPKNIQTGFVVCGRRHHNCYATLVAVLGDDNWQDTKMGFNQTQGFVTSLDRFVNRAEAGAIAHVARQTDQLHDRLISEHLY